jgi:ParB-like chromosome segregation protein Spo0J
MQSATEIKLEYIQTSRYQARMGEDQEHIEKLALSIAHNGLMQTPVGRLVDSAGQPLARQAVEQEYGLDRCFEAGGIRVELAFGNSRLAAYQLLHTIQSRQQKHIPTDDFPADLVEAAATGWDFSRMPVVLRDMDDLALFEAGIRENNDRKDLDPIERAQAMEIYREKFGKTSIEIGKLWRMSDSAVRNTIRLLRLPPAAQDWLRNGQISVGTARALVSLYELTEIERATAEAQDALAKPSEIVELALSGAKPEQLSEMISKLHAWLRPEIQQLTLDMAPEAVEQAFESVKPVPAEPTVSMEDLAGDYPTLEEEISMGYDPNYEPPEEEHPHEEQAPTPPPAPIPAPPQPEPEESEVSVTPPAPEPAPQPQAEPQPEPPAQPQPETAKRLSWEESTIVITITLCPDDGNERGRPAVLGVRANQDAPKIKILRAYDLLGHLPPQAGELLTQVREELEKEG